MRVGVIGVGGHATNSLHPNLASAGMQIVATCARRLDRARAAAERWGATHAFDDAERMLGSVDLDGVVLCVPVTELAGLVAACVAARTPVYVEKPGAGSSTDAADLADTADEAEVPIVVGYMKRFAPAYRRARDIVAGDDFGGPSLASFGFTLGPWARGSLHDWIVDAAVHPLDLARHLLGELYDLRAHAFVAGPGKYTVSAIARTESGAVCTFTLGTTGSWIQRNERVEVFGVGQSVVVDNVDTCVHRLAERPELIWRTNHTVGVPLNTTPTISGFLPALEHFRAMVQDGAENLSSMRNAARTLALAEQLSDLAGGSR